MNRDFHALFSKAHCEQASCGGALPNLAVAVTRRNLEGSFLKYLPRGSHHEEGMHGKKERASRSDLNHGSYSSEKGLGLPGWEEGSIFNKHFYPDSLIPTVFVTHDD